MIPKPPNRQILFDFHTMNGIPDFGEKFDFQQIADYLTECEVDTISFPFRCNQGFSYYPTRIGYPYPTMKYDLMGRMLECAHAAGVRMMIYTNASVFVEGGNRHPEWKIRTREPSVYEQCICSNTAATEHICAQIEEVLSCYDADGLFLDFGYDPPCICNACISKMAKEGIDWERNCSGHQSFARASSLEKMRQMYESCRKIKPDILFFVNGIPFEEKAQYCTHFEYECIPTSRWGYNSLPLFSRYIRNFSKKAINMTGRFHGGWGDFGGIRPQASLEYDVFYGTANGLGSNIGDHFHPRGDMYEPVMRLVSSTMKKLSAIREWTDDCEAETDLAVIVPKGALENTAGTLDAAHGCVRMLSELKQQFDVFSDAMLLQRPYKVLILPDELLMTPALAENLRRHFLAGRPVISSMFSGLTGMESSVEQCSKTLFETVVTPSQDKKLPPCDFSQNVRFAFSEWGLTPQGFLEWDPAYLQAIEPMDELPQMPLTCEKRGLSVRMEQSRMIVEYIAPYFNRIDRAIKHFQYLPPDRPTGKPALCCNDLVAHFTFPIFSAYFKSGRLPYRALLKWCLQRFLADPLIRAPNAPSFAKITVTSQPGRRMIHILGNYPEKRADSMEVIEDELEMHDLPLSLRLDGMHPEKVYQAPSGQKISYVISGGYLNLTLPIVKGYALIVVESATRN